MNLQMDPELAFPQGRSLSFRWRVHLHACRQEVFCIAISHLQFIKQHFGGYLAGLVHGAHDF